MKLRVVAVTLLLLGGWWGYRYAFDTYSRAQVAAASDLVKRYYTHLLAGEYGPALLLVSRPGDQVRDWSYERQWRSRSLQRASQSGEYRILSFAGPELTGGPPHNRPKRQVLTFYATMDIELNGKKDIVAENVLVASVDGQFQIIDFQSTDHFVRYRAYRFQLPRVGNPQ